jgi:peptidoglycan/xylan/chitin deacetylase (PgdA/CDA1 family)
MKLFWVKTNKIVKKLFSNYVWSISTTEPKVYLTFDDGPTPEITEWVLEQLKQYNAKATFFCIGNNIEKHPEIFKNVIADGHSIGNHTFNHVKGWKTSNQTYFEEVDNCEKSIQNFSVNSPQTKLFRPPYGKIKPSQSKVLRKNGYKIIMWDVLSVDFDRNTGPEKCLSNVTENIANGSIIVFHDSKKAFPNLEYALPKTLEFLKNKSFVCEKLC